MNENQLKAKLLSAIPGSYAVEHGQGGETGVADLFVPVQKYNLFAPVELKLYNSERMSKAIEKGNSPVKGIAATHLRVDQVHWHMNVNRVQRTFVLFGDQLELKPHIIVPWPEFVLEGKVPKMDVRRPYQTIAAERVAEYITAILTVEEGTRASAPLVDPHLPVFVNGTGPAKGASASNGPSTIQ